MTKKLDSKVKEQRAEERNRKRSADKDERKKKLKGLIKLYGSAYAAAKALGISSNAFYERMTHVGLSRQDQTQCFLLEGEPVADTDKKIWFETLLKEHKSVPALAKHFKRSVSAIRGRLTRLGIKTGNGLSQEQRMEQLKSLLKEHKTVKAVATKLGVKTQSVYGRMKNYGLPVPTKTA